MRATRTGTRSRSRVIVAALVDKIRASRALLDTQRRICKSLQKEVAELQEKLACSGASEMELEADLNRAMAKLHELDAEPKCGCRKPSVKPGSVPGGVAAKPAVAVSPGQTPPPPAISFDAAKDGPW